MTIGVTELMIVLVLLLLTWCYLKYFRYDHWKKLGVPGPRPVPVLGTFYKAALGRTSLVEDINQVYKKWKKEPFYGVYFGSTPVLMVRDLELMKTILVKDFSTFPGRWEHIPDDDDSLASNILNLSGHRWKVLRSNMTPVFTTGKLKHMVELIHDCADTFEQYLRDEVEKKNVIEMREVAAKFTTDVVGSCAFGINMNSMSSTDSDFRRFGRGLFQSNRINHIKKIIREIAPSVASFLLQFRKFNYQTFFINSIKETLEYREKNNFHRGDLVDILRTMKKNKDEIDIKLTDNILAAQAFVFFAAGFETSSSTISLCCRELALAPDWQDKLYEEMQQTLEKCDKKLSYEAINDMKYLDMVMKETLRKNSVALMVRRESIAPWKIPDTDIILPPRTKIWIPIYSYQLDPDYFKDPEVFDPMRFSEERKSEIIPGSTIPFGLGPKNCVGKRFAVYETKLGILAVLKNFIIKPTEKTSKEYSIDKASIVLAVEGGVPLKLIPR